MGDINMGTVFTEITFRNSGDIAIANAGYIKPEQVRTATVTAIADTGALYPVIPDALRQQLGLNIIGEKTTHIADRLRYGRFFPLLYRDQAAAAVLR